MVDIPRVVHFLLGWTIAILNILLVLLYDVFGLPDIPPSIILIILIRVLFLKFLFLSLLILLLHLLFHSLSMLLLWGWLIVAGTWVVALLVLGAIVLPRFSGCVGGGIKAVDWFGRLDWLLRLRTTKIEVERGWGLLLRLGTPEVFRLIVGRLLGSFFFLALIYEMILLSELVVQEHKAFIVYPEIKLFSVLEKA